MSAVTDEPFSVPFPPPERDVVFFHHRVEDEPSEREDEDIMLRRVPRATAQRFRAAAGGRGMTHAQYLAALVELHELMRGRADAGDAEIAALLERLRLTTVTV